MGSKGAQTVNQNQTYTPNPVAGGAMTDAMLRAQQVSQTPFSTPVAPVAGFSNDQQQAFNMMRGASQSAQPYLNTAANDFTPGGISQFYNPMADSVMAGMKDVFGNQMKQTTGNLTQQAGGVGADRIAVGQSELARQQGLAAGQTLSGLYSQAASQAQGAGFGMGQVGSAIQGMGMQGAQGMLGMGGLQQQLQQAQMNAPYQNMLQQIAWPYQNSQFLTQAIAGLAPGLGGTTAGGTTYPGASPWGTIAGAGMAGAGAYYGAGGGGGKGSNVAADPNVNADTDPSLIGNRGGRVPNYAEGGATDDNPDDLGGTVSTHPLDGAPPSIIPTGQITPMQPHIPQLQQQQQSGGGGKGGMAQAAGTAAKLAMMFVNTGGRVNGYALGGATDPGQSNSMGPLGDLLSRVRGMNGGQPQQGGQPGGFPMGGAGQGGMPGGLMQALGRKGSGSPGGLASAMIGSGGAPSPLMAARGMMGGAPNPLNAARGMFGMKGAGGAPQAPPAPGPMAAAPQGLGGSQTMAEGGATDMGPLDALLARSSLGNAAGSDSSEKTSDPASKGIPMGGLLSMLGDKPQGLISLLGGALPGGLKGNSQGMADGGAPDEMPYPQSMSDVTSSVPGHTDVMGQGYPSPGLMRPESPDMAGPTARAIPRMLAPNLTSLAAGEPEKGPPQIEGHEPGKVPSFEDERLMGAVPEVAGLAGMATPAGAARGIARGIAPALAGEAGSAGSNVGRGLTTGMAASMGATGLSGEAGALEEKKDPADALISEIDGKIKDAQGRRNKANERRYSPNEAQDAQKRKQAVEGIDKELEDLRKERTELNRGRLGRTTDATKHQADLDAPFREKYPLLSNAFMGMGLGISAVLPIGTKMVRAGMNNRFVKDWDAAATKAEEAISAGDRAGAQLYVKQLEGFEKQWGKVPSPKAGATAWGTGVLAPIEASMLPEHLDLISGTPEAKEKALKTMVDPLRVPGAVGAGLTAASISSKIPVRQRLGASEAARGYGATKVEEEMRAADNLQKLRREEINAKARDSRTRNKELRDMQAIEAPKAKRSRKKLPEEAFGGAIGNPFARGGFAEGGFDDRLGGIDEMPFDQRWAATDDAVKSGVFDPGASGDYFGDEAKASRAYVPTPRAKPKMDDDLPPEITAGRSGSTGSPETKEPTTGGYGGSGDSGDSGGSGNPFSSLMSNLAGGKRNSFIDSPWGALMAAGLGTMAASGQRDARGLPMSPYAAIGQGGMQGMGMLQKQRENAQKQQTIDQQAGRLQQQMQLQRTQMMAPVKIGQDRYGRDIYGVRDPQTGKITPINPGGGVGETQPGGGATPLEPGDRDVPDPKDLYIPPAARPAAFNAPMVNSGALEGLPPDEAARVKAIAEGRRKAMSENSRNAPYARYIMSKVHEYDPQYDETTFSRRQRTANFFAVGTQGGGGQNIAAMNTWAQHLDHYLNLTQELNLGQYTDWNSVVVALGKRGYTGEQIQGKLKELDIASKAVADEGAKVFAGTNSALADRQEWEKKFSLETPAKAAIDAARTAQKLVEGRLTSLTHMYNEGMRANHAPLDLVAPETQAVFDKVKKAKDHYGAEGGAPTGGGGEAVPEGTIKQFKQGYGIYRNGKWQPYQNQGPMQ